MSERASEQPTNLDRLFGSLRNRWRRAVLMDLGTREEPVSVPTLAADLPSESDPRTVELALHHVHLPTLADAGLVRYDHTDRTAELAVESLPEISWPDHDDVPG